MILFGAEKPNLQAAIWAERPRLYGRKGNRIIGVLTLFAMSQPVAVKSIVSVSTEASFGYGKPVLAAIMKSNEALKKSVPFTNKPKHDGMNRNTALSVPKSASFFFFVNEMRYE